MFGRWVLVAVALVLSITPAHAGKKFTLREPFKQGDQWKVNLSLQLSGKLGLHQGEKTIWLNLQAAAEHCFPERVLEMDTRGFPARIARYYEQAEANVTVQGQPSKRTVRSDRRFQVAQRHGEETITFSPIGPLTREELHLTGDHFDVLTALQLLPEADVAVGDDWPVGYSTAQSLVGLDAIADQNLRGKLESVSGQTAQVSFKGTVNGISAGAECRIVVDATAAFDLEAKRLATLTWNQKDERGSGPVNPASKTESTTQVRRFEFNTPSEHLIDGVIATAPDQPSEGHLLLAYRDPKGRWEFLYDRDWEVVSQTENYAVFRLLDRGELVAQLNVAPWPDAKPGEHLRPEELRRHIEESRQFTIEEFLQAGVVPDQGDNWVYRMAVAGSADDVRMVQNYYSVASNKGTQLILTFTTEVPQAEKIGDKDLAIVGTITFPASW